MTNSQSNNRILSITLAILLISGTTIASTPAYGAFIGVFVSSGSGGMDKPKSLDFGPDGHLYAISEATEEILKYDGSDGSSLGTFVSSGSGGLLKPWALAFGPDGHLYVTSQDSSEVLKYDGSNGSSLGTFVSSGSGGLGKAQPLVFDPSGNLYVGSEDNNGILKYDGSDGSSLGTFVSSGSGGLDKPYSLTFGPDGNLYVGSYANNKILKYDGSDGSSLGTFVSSGSGGLSSPRALAFGQDGDLYVVSEGTNEVLKYDGSDGSFIEDFVSSGSGGLSTPWALDFDTSGDLYLASSGSNEVLKYDGPSLPNIPPTANADSGNVDDLNSVTIDVAANDSDSDGTLDLTSIIITSNGVNGTAVSNGDGTVDYTHTNGGSVSDSFQYTIDDNLGSTSNTSTVSITVNPVNVAPTVVNDAATVGDLGTVIINVVVNDSDPDGTLDLTSLVITNNGANGNAVANVDGTVDYTHTNTGTFTDSFNYTINDNDGATSNEAVVSMTITPGNIAPTAVNDSTNVDLLGKVILNVTSNDSDSDGTLDLTSLAIITAPQYGTALANSDGTFNYTHTSTSGLLDVFSYTIDDNNGKTSNEATVSLTVIVPDSDEYSSTSSVEEIVEKIHQEVQEERKDIVSDVKEKLKEKYNESTTKNEGNKKQAENKPIIEKSDKEKLNFEVAEIVTTFYEETENVELDTTVDETIVDEAEQQTPQKSKKDDPSSRSVKSEPLPDESAMEQAAKKLGLQYKRGETKVVVELKEDSENVVNEIKEIAKVDTKSDKHVQVTLPINEIPKLVKNPSIEKLRAPLPPVQFDLGHVSEGVFFINADLVHSSGISGQGVKVAVLDLAFDKNNPKISDQIIKSKSFRQGFEHSIDLMGLYGEEGHGTAVAEIVSDVAPNAELYLYTLGTDVEFTAAVDEAINDDVDIIVISAGWPNLPTDGTSHITKKVEEAISHGITFVVPSGNFAEKHWEGNYNDSDENNWHEFSTKDEGLSFKVTEEQITKQQPIRIHLMWDKQETINDYDLVLVDPVGQIVDYSVKEQKSQNDVLSESINYIPTLSGDYAIGITYSGKETNPNNSLEIFSLFNVVEHATKQGSVSVPADANGILVVGAVNHFDGNIETFSSQGPTNIGQQVPHVVGPDGVSTLSLNEKPFYGTSATAPYVAGITALLIETNPELKVEQIFEEIIKNTDSGNISIDDAFDYIKGHGKADASFLAQ